MFLKFILTLGDESNYRQAIPLLLGETIDYILADRGYYSQGIVGLIDQHMHAATVVLTRSNSLMQHLEDKKF